MKAQIRRGSIGTLFSLIVLLITVNFFASCKKGDGISEIKPDTIALVKTKPSGTANNGNTGVNSSNSPAYVMAINAAEVELPQNLLVDNSPIVTSPLAYKQATPYMTVKNGSHQLQFKTSVGASENSIVSLTVYGSNYYSFFYTDDKTIVISHDDHVLPLAGKARVRVINLSSFLNSKVDVGLGTGDSRFITALNQKTPSSFHDVDANSPFSVYKIGSGTIQLSIPGVQAGHIYSLVVSGTTQASLTYSLVIQD